MTILQTVTIIMTEYGQHKLDDLPFELRWRWKTVKLRKNGLPDRRYVDGRNLWQETSAWSEKEWSEKEWELK